MERVERIELSSLVWKTSIIAAILHPRTYITSRMSLMILA